MSISKNPRLIEIAKIFSRDLRKNSTASEKKFWELVRNNKINNKFYRQYAIFFDYEGKETFYIADFYCRSKKLVIEIDGKIHNYQKGRDALRTHIINSLGIRVIRYKNEEIDKNILRIKEELVAILGT